MKKILTIAMLCLLSMTSMAQQKKIWNETEKEKEERLAWWTADRFGMFIHWGTYSLAARHEWVKKLERISDEEYQKYFDNFNPDLYDPAEWAKLAKAAGMKYAVITTKHHEGFTLFDSEYTDYKMTNTPYGKDGLREWVEAFRAEGLKIGFYYSLIDFHHPDYTIDIQHPQQPASDEEYAALNKDRDMSIYREYLKNQVTELLTNYGKIDMLWLDFSFPGEYGKDRDDWGSVELLKLVRKLQPHILVNDRADLREYEGGWDFGTPEQVRSSNWPVYKGEKVPWETCQTLTGSWVYNRDSPFWKDTKQLLVLLIESVSKGGNLLLNVGPTGRGKIENKAENALLSMGEWMKYNDRSIYGCTEAPETIEVPGNTLLTYNPGTNRLYVHLLDYPGNSLTMLGMKGKIKYAQLLHDASVIPISSPTGYWLENMGLKEDDIFLSLPAVQPEVEIPVIELILY